jgi:hypothetical protein
MPFFRRAKINVVEATEKPVNNPRESAEQASEHQGEAKMEPLGLAELEELEGQWRKALAERAEAGLPDVLVIEQGDEERYFYLLARSADKVEQGRTIMESRCLRDDFRVYDIRQVLNWHPIGLVSNIEEKFQELDPVSAGLDQAKTLRLVKEIIFDPQGWEAVRKPRVRELSIGAFPDYKTGS